MNPRGSEPNTDGYGTYESARQAESYVSEILEQEAQLQELMSVSPTRKRWGTVALAIAVPVFLALTAVNMYITRLPPEPLSPEVARQEAQVGIYLAIQQIKAFRGENGGRIPSSLEEVGADAPGLVFERSAQGYQIVADIEGTVERYVHGEDASRFEAAATSLFTPSRGGR